MKCKWKKAWRIGSCNEESGDQKYCTEHRDKVCVSCGNPARDISSTYLQDVVDGTRLYKIVNW